MFFKKEKKCPDPFADKRKCAECKAYFDLDDMSPVCLDGMYTEFYCPAHKKPYTKYNFAFSGVYYFAEMQVDENGTPIGYKKIESKK